MYVCICNEVTDRQVKEAVDQGARTIRDLNKELCVGNCCGKCASFAKKLIQSHAVSEKLDSDR